MTLRPETVRERLALVRSNLEALSSTASLPRDRFLADRKEQWAAAYGLQSSRLLRHVRRVASAR